MRAVWCVAVVVAGCGRTSSPAGPDCTSTVEAMLRLDTADNNPAARAALIKRCVDDAWSAEARACMHDAKTEAEGDACGRLLTPAQKKAASAAWGAAVPDTSVPLECYGYSLEIKKLDHCDKLPPATRDALIAAYKQASASWPGQTREALEVSCRAAADAVSKAAEGCK